MAAYVRKSRNEPPSLTWWYSFQSAEIESNFQLYHIRTKNFRWSRILFYAILCFICCLYWSSIIQSVGDDYPWVWAALVLSSLAMILSNGAALLVSFLATPEQLVSLPLADLCMSLMAVSNMIGISVILYLQCAFDLCLPMATFIKSCERDAFPGDVVLSQLFLPVLIQNAFPSFSWSKILLVYSLCCFLALAVAWNSNSYHQMPLLFLAVIYSLGSLFTNRYGAVKSYLLQLDMEYRKEIEQEAKLSERLRIMISGIAHDLRSPLSALSLGCESIYHVYNAYREICYDLPGKVDRMSRAVQLLDTLHEVAQWIHNSKQAMNTIVSRCIDINQALGGTGLLPTLQVLSVREELERLVKHYETEYPDTALYLEMKCGDDVFNCFEDFSFCTDRGWFLENINCLLHNAIKFSDCTDDTKSKVVLSVSRTTRSRSNSFPTLNSRLLSSDTSDSLPVDQKDIEERLRIEVIDEGEGVDADGEKTLFTFLGNSSQMNVGGAGLGLYTLACRVKALNGEYGYHHRGWINGEKLPGSVFWFEMPEMTAPVSRSRKFPSESSYLVELPVNSSSNIADAAEDIVPLGTSLSSAIIAHLGESNEASMSPSSGIINKNVQSITETNSVLSPLGISGGLFEEEDREGHSMALLEVCSYKSDASTQGEDSEFFPQKTEFSSTNSTIDRHHTDGTKIPPLRILVVDDSLPIRKMCAMILKQQGHTVTTAVNGKEALQLMCENCTDCYEPPVVASNANNDVSSSCDVKAKTSCNKYCAGRFFDLVLMDIQMPVMDGIEAVQLFRDFEKDNNYCYQPANSRYSTQFPSRSMCLPIIGMSACSDADIINRAIRAGMRDFMSKPFQMQQFQDIVAHIFDLDNNHSLKV